jgi:hypothetical protein
MCAADRRDAFDCAPCGGRNLPQLRDAGCDNAQIAAWCAGAAPTAEPPVPARARLGGGGGGALPTGSLRWMSFYNFWVDPAYGWNLTEAAMAMGHTVISAEIGSNGSKIRVKTPTE